MATQVQVKDPPSKAVFPDEQVRQILREEIEEAADESAPLHESWEPLLDSLRMITVITTLEDLFGFSLPPEKVVRKGGYTSRGDCEDDMMDNVRRLWEKHH